MDLESFAQRVQAIVACVTAARLLHLGLARRQPALIAFLLTTALLLFALGSFPNASVIYFWLYLAYVVVNWVVSIFAVREMFTLALVDYPGIGTAGRWAMYGVTGFSVAVSVVVTAIFWNGGAHGRSMLFYIEVADRSIVFTLGLAVAAIIFFLSRYPLHLHPNTYISTVFFSAVFLSGAAETLLDSLNPHLYSAGVDTIQIAFAAVCFAGWALMLRPETAQAPAPVHVESPSDRHLLQQPESLNRLAKAGRP
jgi:hypothetical protein